MYVAKIPCQGRVGGVIHTFMEGDVTEVLDEGKDHPHFEVVEDGGIHTFMEGDVTEVLDEGKDHPHFEVVEDGEQKLAQKPGRKKKSDDIEV